ncbi:type II secretion system protein [Mucisphaera calidilacus]|uniref:Prepilin-type N-terminal cleavage/methylation domain-containing protein n=1 Tax=Mucisphaera calidilacus TaxID=2527982 RepID=A0A518BXF7_9BACT|nr:type II secretion system protein [Mucisphaera calidilacus]QDU71657.1 hypothetical protein Pan265_15090 [Mucisphaera calidilacus]
MNTHPNNKHTREQRTARPQRGFTTIELLVVVSIIALLVAILLPTLGAVQRMVRQMEAGSQARNIHTGLTVFAQDNNSWFPGASNQGVYDDPTKLTGGGYTASNPNLTEISDTLGSGDDVTEWWADVIVWTLLDKALVTPDDVISPAEPDKSAWDGGYDDDSSNGFPAYLGLRTTDTGPAHSYAYLDPRPGDEHPAGTDDGPTNRVRIKNWRDTTNSQAPILADRILKARPDDLVNGQPADFDYSSGSADYANYRAEGGSGEQGPGGGISIHQLNWGSRDSATWQGVVVWNDGRSEFSERIVPVTKLSDNFAVKQNANRTGDDLFFPFSQDEDDDDRNDAVMLYANTN